MIIRNNPAAKEFLESCKHYPIYFDQGKWWTMPKKLRAKMAAIERIKCQPFY